MAYLRGNRTTSGSQAVSSAELPLMVGVLALALFLSGFCGILAELSLFNLAENLLGGTNRNLTYTMGFMMFAMGIGAAMTGLGWFRAVPIDWLIVAELAISVSAMVSVVSIYTLAGLYPPSAPWLIWGYGPVLGLIIGLEIPLVLRINEGLGLGLRFNAALVLAPDYLGALAAFVAFAFWLLPDFGLARAAWLGGLLNLTVAGLVLWVFRARLQRPLLGGVAFGLAVVLAVGLGWRLESLMAAAEQLHYRDGIVWHQDTPHQRLVVTSRATPGNPAYRTLLPKVRRRIAREGSVSLLETVPPHPFRCREDIRLFINGGLQFSTCDEHRYHEMLVHPAWFLVEQGRDRGASGKAERPRALVLGGGDGMAVRELLKYPQLSVELVELDPAMVTLFRDDPRFSRLNGGALSSPRVKIHIGDAFRFLHRNRAHYNLIVLDFPDPHQTATARLYTRQLYLAAAGSLAPGGIVVTQSFSPLYHQQAFLVVRKTMAAAGLKVVSLQVPMLTFEHWGFQVGSRTLGRAEMEARLERFRTAAPTRYLNRAAVQAAYRWDKEIDLGYDALPVNEQFTLPLVRIYNQARAKP